MAGEVATQGAEALGGSVFGTVVGAHPFDRQAAVSPATRIGPGDDDHLVAFPYEDAVKVPPYRDWGTDACRIRMRSPR